MFFLFCFVLFCFVLFVLFFVLLLLLVFCCCCCCCCCLYADTSLLSESTDSPTDLTVMEPVMQLPVSESTSIKSQSINKSCDAKTSSAENQFDSHHTVSPDNTMQLCKSPNGTENSSGLKSPVAESPLANERSSLSTYASPSPASPRVASVSPQQRPQNGKYLPFSLCYIFQHSCFIFLSFYYF